MCGMKTFFFVASCCPFQHRRCSSSHSSLRGITHSITHSHILLQSLIKPYSLFNSVNSVNNCSAVLPPSPMVFFVKASSNEPTSGSPAPRVSGRKSMVRSPLVMAKPPRMNIGTLKKEKVLLNPKEAKSKIKLIQLHLHLVRGCPSQELQKWRKEGAQSEKQTPMCK